MTWYGHTTTFELAKWKALNRDDRNKVLGTLNNRNTNGVFALRIIVPEITRLLN